VQGQEPEYSKQARKFLENLEKKPYDKITKAISLVPKGDIIPYKSIAGYFRLRVGGYRVLFEWVEDDKILVAFVEGRDKIYKKGV